MQPNFLFFYTNYMSNFEWSPIVENGIMFGSSEQYFMYYKALEFNDTVIAEKILEYPNNPMECKRLGGLVKGYVESIWANKRYEVMLRANILKYTQNHDLGYKLKATLDLFLVEASGIDKIWGIGISVDEAKRTITSINQFKGQNLLGRVLMEVRDLLPSLASYQILTNKVMTKRCN